VYARAVFRWVGIVVAVMAAALSCSGPTEAERSAALCRDLENLRDTVGVLVAPPPGVDVGILRGALEKLDPTIGELESSPAVVDGTADAMRDAQESFRDAIEGVGDDERLPRVATAIERPASEVAAAYEALVESLRCIDPAG